MIERVGPKHGMTGMTLGGMRVERPLLWRVFLPFALFAALVVLAWWPLWFPSDTGASINPFPGLLASPWIWIYLVPVGLEGDLQWLGVALWASTIANALLAILFGFALEWRRLAAAAEARGDEGSV